MIWFTKTKIVPIKVDKTFEERLEKAEREISKLKTESLDCATDINALRSKVLRKIQTRKEEEDQTEEKPKAYIPGHPFY